MREEQISALRASPFAWVPSGCAPVIGYDVRWRVYKKVNTQHKVLMYLQFVSKFSKLVL